MRRDIWALLRTVIKNESAREIYFNLLENVNYYFSCKCRIARELQIRSYWKILFLAVYHNWSLIGVGINIKIETDNLPIAISIIRAVRGNSPLRSYVSW